MRNTFKIVSFVASNSIKPPQYLNFTLLHQNNVESSCVRRTPRSDDVPKPSVGPLAGRGRPRHRVASRESRRRPVLIFIYSTSAPRRPDLIREPRVRNAATGRRSVRGRREGPRLPKKRPRRWSLVRGVGRQCAAQTDTVGTHGARLFRSKRRPASSPVSASQWMHVVPRMNMLPGPTLPACCFLWTPLSVCDSPFIWPLRFSSAFVISFGHETVLRVPVSVRLCVIVLSRKNCIYLIKKKKQTIAFFGNCKYHA